MLPNHFESVATVKASVESVFAYADDPAHLSSHMGNSSWMMGGGTMVMKVDAGEGKSVGSVISLAGRAFGIELFVEESVAEHSPPNRKIWETFGEPKLMVIGPYRMGFEVSASGPESSIRVFIDYALPKRGFSRFVGWMFGRPYAKWCTRRMMNDTVKHFAVTQVNGAQAGS